MEAAQFARKLASGISIRGRILQDSLFFSLLAGNTVGDWSDLHWLASQPVRSLSFLWQNTRKGPQIGGFWRVLQSLGFQESNRNSLLVRKVSRVFLGNGGFAESKSGDWFDIALDARPVRS